MRMRGLRLRPAYQQKRRDSMRMYSYDQVLTDVKDVYEQITGLPAPEIDIKKPRYPLPKGINPVALVQSEINQINSILTVRGARRFKKADEEAVYHSSERNYGTFERLFPLPGNILAERIKSKFTNGILQITIPKTKADLSGRSE